MIFDRQTDKMRHSLQQFEVVVNGMVFTILGDEMGYLRPGYRQNLHGAGEGVERQMGQLRCHPKNGQVLRAVRMGR